jgi:HEAT repeat protein
MDSDLRKLLKDLESKNGITRQRARHQLVKIGKPVLNYLSDLNSSPKEYIRWEALKILSQIPDPDSIPILVNALDDENFDVRWLAAEGLIHIGSESIIPLLEFLVINSDSVFVKEGVHHVLKEFEKNKIYEDKFNLLNLLEDFAPASTIATTADEIIKSLKK